MLRSVTWYQIQQIFIEHDEHKHRKQVVNKGTARKSNVAVTITMCNIINKVLETREDLQFYLIADHHTQN